MLKDKKSIVFFLLLTFALSGVCYFIRIMGGDAAAGMMAVLMWCPGVAAFITKAVFYRRENILGFNKCKIQPVLLALVLPLLYLGISYGAFWAINKASFAGQVGQPVPMLLLLFPSAFATAIGEEIGWRGFLLPKMAAVWGIKAATFVSGLIWAVWHFPLMLAGVYQSGTPIWYALPVFTVEIVAITAILAVLQLKSNSVWPAAIFHTSHNYFDQVIFAPATQGESSFYYVGETGVITAILLLVVAGALILKNKKSVKA